MTARDEPAFLGAPDFPVSAGGGKATTLHLLALDGFDVPPGFVIPAVADIDGYTDLQLRDWVHRIGGFPVAVRSSGAAEDLAGASFAGQYDSFLHVADVETLRHRIAECRKSAATDRVVSYSAKTGHDLSEAQVAVLVQRQVDARVAGVAFTIDPLSGVEDLGVIEYCTGLADKLVSGHVTGSRITVRLRDAAVQDRAGDDELSAVAVRSLAATMLAVQAHRHRPQDLEWAFDHDGRLWLLQARPITAIAWRTDIGQYTDADFRDGGVSARVCTPLMYSLYRNAFQSTMQQFFVELGLQSPHDEPEWISQFYGRPYWNVEAVKRCFLKVPDWDEQDFDTDLGVNKDYGPAGPARVPVTAATVVGALPVALASSRLRRRALTAVTDFEKSWEERYSRWKARVPGLSECADEDFAGQLRDCLLNFHADTEQTYFRLIYNNTVLQSDVKRLITKVDAATSGTTSLIELMGGLAGVSHMELQRATVRLYEVAGKYGFAAPEWAQALREFLDQHGFHSDVELDLTCPRWAEAPDRVQAMIEAMLTGGVAPADPDAAVAAQQLRYGQARADLDRRVRARPWARLRYRRSVDRMIGAARRYLIARESMRQCSAQCYAIVRSFVLEAGDRLAARGVLERAEDVFMLSVSEVVEYVSGRVPGDVAELVTFRRAMYDGYRDLVPPHELGAGIDAVANASGGNVLAGLGCSPGVVEGVARVIGSLRDIDQVCRGDILVTQYTDPGWTPALGLVAGVVTEVGGMLSHAAVIGREYGIPAVLNVAGATTTIRSGQRLRVDGRAGTVEVVRESAIPAGKRIICVTGGDGAGKSTQIAALSATLTDGGSSCAEVSIWDGLQDSTISEHLPFGSAAAVYRYLQVLTPNSRVHFLYHALQLAIDLAVRKGADTMLINGYWYKYFATEVAHGGDPNMLRALTAGFPEPDLTFYLSTSADDALARKHRRSDYESGYGDENEFLDFQQRSRSVLDDLAAELNWVRIDGRLPPADITTAILAGLDERGGL